MARPQRLKARSQQPLTLAPAGALLEVATPPLLMTLRCVERDL
jgi:hypothetical protein